MNKPILEEWQEKFKNNWEVLYFPDREIGNKMVKCSDSVKQFIKEYGEAVREATIAECVEIPREHLVMNWSGETEVYGEVERIAKKIEALLTLKD